MSYNVRFVCIPSVEGVKCTLDGVVKYTVAGFADFYNISVGAHSYSVVAPSGMKFVSGEDAFKRPLGESGTTVIEVPGGGVWPTEIPWLLKFNFEVEVVKKPTALALSVSPTSGAPPYDVWLTPVLRSNGVAVPYKTVSIYKNGSFLTSGNTDSGGKIERTDTVTAESSYYAQFAGDSEYEASKSETKVVSITELPEFRFDSWNPGALDFREVFIVGAAWPALVRTVDVGEDVYTHYVVKNVGSVAGKATITVKDLDTGSVITTWSSPELAPNERFKTEAPGAYIGKMPNRAWRLEFKVDP